MVTADEVAQPGVNFGVRTLRNQLDVSVLTREIARYDAHARLKALRGRRSRAGGGWIGALPQFSPNIVTGSARAEAGPRQPHTCMITADMRARASL
jgi:hypothetical protein